MPPGPPWRRSERCHVATMICTACRAGRLKGTAANMTTCIAVIGAGHWGPNLIRNFHHREESEVAWVVDRDPARLQGVQARFPGIRVGAELDDVLHDDSVDAVVVVTPTTTHYNIAKRALECGKHVMVEKPLTSNVEQAVELCELAEGLGLV